MDGRLDATGSPVRNIGLLSLAQATMGSNQAILTSIASLTAAGMVAEPDETPSAASAQPWPAEGAGWFALAAIIFATFTMFFDQTVFGLLAERIKGSFGISDSTLGFLLGPASVIGVLPIALGPGDPATLTIFDPSTSWTVTPEMLASKGKNTPLMGQEMRGQVMMTMCEGQVVFRRGEFGTISRRVRGGAVGRLEGVFDEEDETPSPPGAVSA